MVERSPATILIIEDDPDTSEALSDLLAAIGYRVACAADGREALSYLRRNPPPRLVLADLGMPVMNGWVFTIEQHRDPTLATIPVVLLSGNHDVASAAQYLGADDYLQKPIDADRLFGVLRRYCEVSRPAAEPRFAHPDAA
jgi:CheY-like chemotaxis protein